MRNKIIQMPIARCPAASVEEIFASATIASSIEERLGLSRRLLANMLGPMGRSAA